jgi:hypothetical protein
MSINENNKSYLSYVFIVFIKKNQEKKIIYRLRFLFSFNDRYMNILSIIA